METLASNAYNSILKKIMFSGEHRSCNQFMQESTTMSSSFTKDAASEKCDTNLIYLLKSPVLSVRKDIRSFERVSRKE